MKPIVPITTVALVSLGVAWFGEPFVRENTDFFLATVTLFAVFGGFLVAVLSIGGDALAAQRGSWAKLELLRDSAIARLDRAKLLFFAYLIAAALILIVLAIHKSCNPLIMSALPIISYLSLWFTVMGLLFSFALPSMLINIQQHKIDGQIEKRRATNSNGSTQT
jgi:hypothetical protein